MTIYHTLVVDGLADPHSYMSHSLESLEKHVRSDVAEGLRSFKAQASAVYARYGMSDALVGVLIVANHPSRVTFYPHLVEDSVLKEPPAAKLDGQDLGCPWTDTHVARLEKEVERLRLELMASIPSPEEVARALAAPDSENEYRAVAERAAEATDAWRAARAALKIVRNGGRSP